MIGKNAGGGRAKYAGSLGIQSVKIFDLVAARIGLRDDEASQGGRTRSELHTAAQQSLGSGAHEYPGVDEGTRGESIGQRCRRARAARSDTA